MVAGDREEVLGLGKVSNEVLERSVFPHLPLVREPELDAGIIETRGTMVVAHSPSIGVPLESLGFFAFHYAASNVAARFAVPRYMVTGLYMPLDARERDLESIAEGLGTEARKFGVSIVAGQTATYTGIEIPLVTTTCLGNPVRSPTPAVGDVVYVVGEVGGEATWLKGLSDGIHTEHWRSFTPLPSMLRLMNVEGVSTMHDISEGGVKKALQEVVHALDMRLEIRSDDIKYAEGVEGLGGDPLRFPTYGTFIALVAQGSKSVVEELLEAESTSFAKVGEVRKGDGLFINGSKIKSLGRIDLDWLYGSFDEPV